MLSRRIFSSFFVNGLKVGLAAGLIYWMSASGKLNFAELSAFVEQPLLLAAGVAQWTFVSAFLCSLRWLILLRGLELPVTLKRAAQLNLVGIFFNSVMPGAVGGDLIKAAYVIRDQQSRKTPAMMTILLDRIVGLMGLFVVGSVAVVLNLGAFWPNPLLRPVVLFVFGVLAAMVVIYIMALMPMADEKDPIMRILSLQFPGSSILQKIYRALRSYRHRPWAMVYALLISVLAQTINMFYFMYLTTAVTGQSIDFARFASIFPIGVLTTALPLAPGGLGVGHVAFEKLYETIGLHGGANVFNLYVLASLTFSLVGIFPYLTIGKPQVPVTVEA